MKNTMHQLFKNIIFIYKSRRSWWYTSTLRSKARLSRTVLGSFWLGLSNLITILLLSIIYKSILNLDNFLDYFIYLGLGLSIWSYINSSIVSSSYLLEINSINIKNLNINPIYYVVEEWSFQFQTFIQSFSLIMLVLAFLKFNLIINLFIYALPSLLNLLVFLFWFPLLICIIGSRYQDLYQLTPIFMQLLFLLSPILYKKESLNSFSWLADINIIFSFLMPVRGALINAKFYLGTFNFLFIFNIIGLFITLRIFQRIKSKIPLIV